jgi:hypothetical protein
VDVKQPEESPPEDHFVCVFPSEARAMPVEERHPLRFRQEFLSHIARQLSWNFSNYPRSEQRIIESIE